MSPRKRRPAEKLRSLYLWHRYAGLLAALLVIWLAATGIALNHTEDLNLSGTFVRQQWLLSLYNVDAPQELKAQRLGGYWLTQSSGRVYLDESFIGEGATSGAVRTSIGIVVAFPSSLALYTTDARLIERTPFTATATPITGLIATPDGIVIAAGEERFLADADLMRFEPMPAGPKIPPPALEPLPPELAHAVAADVRQHSIDWERVLLDLHAGRIFGKTGVWLADLAGVLLLLLAVSGVIVWIQRARARRQRGEDS